MDTAKASVLQIKQGACCEWTAPFSVVEHGEDKFILHMNFKRPQEIWDSQTWSMLGQDFVLVRATEIKRRKGSCSSRYRAPNWNGNWCIK